MSATKEGVSNLSQIDSKVSIDDLVQALDCKIPEIRRGVLKAILKLLTSTTELSNSDLRMVAKDISPNIQSNMSVQPRPAGKQKKPKAPKPLDPRIIAIKAKYPNGGDIDSPYAVAMIAARKTIKAEKALKKTAN